MPKIFVILLIFCLLAGCAAPTQPPATVTPSPEPLTAIFTSAPPTETPVPTATFTSALKATPTKVVLPTDSVVQNQCPKISKQPKSDFARGALVVFHREMFSGPDWGYGYLDLHTNSEVPLSSTTLATGGDVSPSKDRIAYWGLNENDLSSFLVIDMVGRTQSIRPENPKVGIMTRGWLDDQRLIIRVYKNLQGPPPIDPPPHDIALFNPFTGEVQIITPDFPNISKKDVDWNYSGPAFYDQSLNYGVYAAWNEATNAHEYILYQISSKTSMAKLPGSTHGGLVTGVKLVSIDGVMANPPAWSLDSTRVTLISPAPEEQTDVDEIFAITKDGEIQRLTYLAKHFDKAKVSQLSWSPDGKSIAFWVALDPAPYELSAHAVQDERLAIVNTETLAITVYCISGNEMGIRNIGSGGQFVNDMIPAPIWSPDGTQVLVENRYDSDFSRLIILDIANGQAAQVGESLEPLGWMIQAP